MTETEEHGAEEGNSNNNDTTKDDDDEESRDSYSSFDIDHVIRGIGGREADRYKISKFTIGEGYYLPRRGDWEVLGRAIGKNTYLKEVELNDWHGYFIRQEDLLKFLPGFVMNCSIQKLRFAGLNLNDKFIGGLNKVHPSKELLNMFAQFFNNSKALECLEVDEDSDDKLLAIASLLKRCTSLKELILVNENAWSQCGRTGENVRYISRVDCILDALTGNTGLRKLTIADAKIGVGGSNSLAMLLQNPTINLTSLTLNATEMYDSRRSYRDLDYYFHNESDNESGNESDEEEDVDEDEVGVETVKEKDEKIDNDTDDEDDETAAQAAKIFASGLCGNVTLKELEISHMGPVPSRQNSAYPEDTIQLSNAGWQAIFVALQISKCGLEKLSLHDNWIGASILSLPSALQNHATTLKTLNLSSTCIDRSHFAVFFQFLQDPNVTLEVLDLSHTQISDEGLHALATALEGNSTLKELYLVGNSCDTEAGWEAFSTVLRNSNSALEKLDMRKCCIKVNAFISIANSLANNNRLRELQFQLHTSDVTVSELDSHSKSVVSDCGTALFLNILCNKSSILSTYHSNHTLTKVYKETVKGSCTHYSRSNDLEDLLAINANNSVSQAARLKIIKTHCIINRKKSTQILSYKEREVVTMILLGQRKRQMNMQPFVDMDVSVRAYALAWMARDQYLYHFLRAMPSLLGKVVSRKRTIGLVE